jgi:hypothetical protein
MLNINEFDRIYRRKKKTLGVTGEVVRLHLERVKQGRLRVLTHATVENTTTAYTKCRLGIDHGGVLHYLDELQTIAADELAVSRSDVLLGEGDRFFAELTGTTDGDELIMTCIGWEQSL